VHKRIYSLLTVGGMFSGALYVVACGGGGGGKTDGSVVLKDSPVMVDALTCALSSADIAGLGSGVGLGGSGTGSAAALTAQVDTMTNQLEVFEVVTGISTDMSVGIFFGLIDSGSGAFSTAEAGKFTGPPITGSWQMDQDDAWGAGFDIVNGITDNGDGTVSIKPTQGYLYDGTATSKFAVTTWTGKAAANGTSTFNGTFTGASMQAGTIDASNNFTMDSCASATVNFELFTTIKWPATIPAGAARPRVWHEGDSFLSRFGDLSHVPVVHLERHDQE